MSLIATKAAQIAFMALSLLGRSALLWEPTITIGTGVSIIKERAAAVYIMVSVPWVIITPAAPVCISSTTDRARFCQDSESIFSERILEITLPLKSAISLSSGIAARISSAVNWDVTAPVR